VTWTSSLDVAETAAYLSRPVDAIRQALEQLEADNIIKVTSWSAIVTAKMRDGSSGTIH
jgi:hypothetical protein